MTNQEIIMRFFNSWITKDFSRLDDYFNQNAIYVESYGPWYQGLSEIKAWINHKKKTQTVNQWDIKRILDCGNNTYTVEWYFNADENGHTEFDGVSIIEFKNGKIEKLSEFGAKHELYRPYEQK